MQNWRRAHPEKTKSAEEQNIAPGGKAGNTNGRDAKQALEIIKDSDEYSEDGESCEVTELPNSGCEEPNKKEFLPDENPKKGTGTTDFDSNGKENHVRRAGSASSASDT